MRIFFRWREGDRLDNLVEKVEEEIAEGECDGGEEDGEEEEVACEARMEDGGDAGAGAIWMR